MWVCGCEVGEPRVGTHEVVIWTLYYQSCKRLFFVFFRRKKVKQYDGRKNSKASVESKKKLRRSTRNILAVIRGGKGSCLNSDQPGYV